MKKNVLALSIATMIGGLGFAGIAAAGVIVGTNAPLTTSGATDLQLADGGVGHMLVVPYFTAQDGNMSVFHVVNSDTVNGKVVKVRFRGASNSDDILDFQVYLSPSDVWTAAVSQSATGEAQIQTADTSCTVPRLTPGTPKKFVTNRLKSSLSDADKANETREGYVELFNVADVPPTLMVAGAAGTGANKLYDTIKHTSTGGAPACATSVLESTAALSNITDQGVAGTQGFNTPSGGLFGDWYVINVAQTTTFSGAATAVQAIGAVNATTGRVHANFVHFPQSAVAVTGTGANAIGALTADPLLSVITAPATSPAITAAWYDLPDLSTPYVTAPAAGAARDQAGLLTQTLAATQVSNQYATAPAISAKTDWVFSMPTRRYSVAYDYTKTGTAGLVFSTLTVGGVAPVGGQWFNAGNVTVNGTQICTTAANQQFVDREEQTKTSGAVFSPGEVSKVQLCGETSVVSFGGSVLGSTVAHSTASAESHFVNGWGTVSFAAPGVPLLGAGFTKLTNPQAQTGVSGNYGITWPHRYVRAN